MWIQIKQALTVPVTSPVAAIPEVAELQAKLEDLRAGNQETLPRVQNQLQEMVNQLEAATVGKGDL